MPKKAVKGKSAEDDDDQFESADSGAAKVVPKQCSALRKSDYVMIKGHPCKIVEMSTSKTGKHGHAKVHMVGIDIFKGTKHEDICPSTHNMDVPLVDRKEYQVIDVVDGYFVLMTDTGDTKEDLKVPDEEEMQKTFIKDFSSDETNFITVMSALGDEKAVSCKANK